MSKIAFIWIFDGFRLVKLLKNNIDENRNCINYKKRILNGYKVLLKYKSNIGFPNLKITGIARYLLISFFIWCFEKHLVYRI